MTPGSETVSETSSVPAPDAPGVAEKPPPGAHTMAIFRWLLIGLMAIVAASSLAYSYGWFRPEQTKMQTARYYCPMHPQVVQDHPGECPICNMTLVPGGDAHPSGTHGSTMAPPAADKTHESVPGLVPVELAFDRTQLIGVRTERAVKERLGSELRTVGFVAVDESRVARVHARFSGWIERLLVATTGQWVEKGAPLLSVFNRELMPAQQEFLGARKWSAAAPTDPANTAGASGLGPSLEQDARTRLELLGMSPAEIDGIAQTGTPTRTLSIAAPIAGHVVRKNAVQGAYVEPGMELFEIADLSRIWVLADVYEAEIDRIKVGRAARIKAGAYPELEFKGKVSFIYPAVNTETRTLRIRIELPNPGVKLRPGMYGDVFVDLAEAESVTIPSAALIDTGEYQYVFIAKQGGRFEPRRVRAGTPRDGKVPILSGVSEGDEVVTTANFLIDSESRLRAAIEGTSATSGKSTAVASACDRDFDKQRHPEKYAQCRECERVHRGMGTMEDDCKNAIAKPWR